MIPLLRTQKNQVFQALKDGGLEDEAIERLVFRHSEELSNWKDYAYDYKKDGYVITYSDGSFTYFFSFQGNGNSWSIEAFPLGVANSRKYSTDNSWAYVLKNLKEWAYRIQEEIKADDYWDRFVEIRAQFTLDDEEEIDNSPFSSKEANVIRGKLNLLEKELLRRYSSNAEHRDYLRRKFQYIDDCLDRQGKTDWLHTLVGVLASTAIALGVSAANNDMFWQIVRNTLGSTIKLLTGN